jgi:hypothetical protein
VRLLAVGTALGAGLLIAGCGATSSTSVGSAPPTPASGTGTAVPMACGSGRTTVTVGRVIAVEDCAAGVTAKAGNGGLSAAGDDRFRAVRAGATSIVLSAGPSCSPGTLCPQYLRFVGVISVTVVAA